MTPEERVSGILKDCHFGFFVKEQEREYLVMEFHKAINDELREIMEVFRKERESYTAPGNFRETEIYRRCISIIEDRMKK